jgi:hypothetical protein
MDDNVIKKNNTFKNVSDFIRNKFTKNRNNTPPKIKNDTQIIIQKSNFFNRFLNRKSNIADTNEKTFPKDHSTHKTTNDICVNFDDVINNKFI